LYEIFARLSGDQEERSGRVERVLGELDPYAVVAANDVTVSTFVDKFALFAADRANAVGLAVARAAAVALAYAAYADKRQIHRTSFLLYIRSYRLTPHSVNRRAL